MNIPANTGRTPKSDEVLRRVGRNLVIFQQIEARLKFILTVQRVDGPMHELESRRKMQAERINKETLGTLANKYASKALRDAGDPVPEEAIPADWFAFTIHTEVDSEFNEELRRDLQVMTNERNELVHHFLPRWQPEDDEALNSALEYLDAQRARVEPIEDHLDASIQCMREAARLFADFMASPEYQRQTELWHLQSSLLVVFLGKVSDQFHRKDGWTYLSHAGGLAGRDLPEEVKNLNHRYGVQTLKQLLVCAEMFDLLDEITPGGGFRTLYRRKIREQQ